MAKINQEDVEYLALLARLNLNEEEKKMLSEQIEEILNYVEKINQLNTEDVLPTFNVLPLGEKLREDKAKQEFNCEDLLKNALQRKDNFFKVPKVV
ncbi:Asp-tRNA(Asn)/Glu-tRNA(Gln) amidotransferase subunit GatC [bacterium]|nr:Asp-tRNA(Asn)/Glu-tRNA(Gln) amidotransferase subunit GatC [bacterium]MBU1153016.1 Asp-tRNA(Asn)/Glu-tRNA(Gln) amidotransferase subunit GatC [bacterium]MBU2599457.1 Asp-tRNA(Asn)/Glu-tRNA(Gln) amidotransferase subunit GatC [bacterium]